MGLKSGSRDSGLDDAEEGESAAGDAAADEGSPTSDEAGAGAADTESEPTESGASESAESTDDRPSMSAIPYKLRRNKVNEGREQVPYFLREEVIEGEEELQSALEELLGESVYKSDYREAAMVVAQRNPELIAGVLREWGYDLESE